MRYVTVATTLALLASAPACDKPSGASDGPGSEEASETEETAESSASKEAAKGSDESENKSTESASDWERVAEDDLGADRSAALERARAARKKLGKTLKSELQRAVSDRSFPGAVKFCNARAPEIAKSVADEDNLEIGRTSHKLRNPDNTPPEWATEAVERRKARQYVFRGPDDRVGYLHPIEMKGLCVNCHGSDDQLAPGVEEMLSKHYPEDEATGFEVGDLRGWFWVEATPRGS